MAESLRPTVLTDTCATYRLVGWGMNDAFYPQSLSETFEGFVDAGFELVRDLSVATFQIYNGGPNGVLELPPLLVYQYLFGSIRFSAERSEK